MDNHYIRAREVALGRELPANDGGMDIDNMWRVGGSGMTLELSEQLFERKLEMPDELLAQRAALSLYDDDYKADCGAADKLLRELTAALEKKSEKRLSSLLSQNPPDGWLSYVFLDESALSERLLPYIEATSEGCRVVLSEALQASLERLKNYKQLLESLLNVTKEARA